MKGVRRAITTWLYYSSQATGATHLALFLLDPLRLHSQAAQGGWEVKAQGDWRSGPNGPSPAVVTLHRSYSPSSTSAGVREERSGLDLQRTSSSYPYT